MSGVKSIHGDLLARNARFGIVLSRYNDFVGERLLQGAIDTLERHGAQSSNIEVVRIPGAFEMPLVAKTMAASKRYDALIALGVVVRGETPHFEYVANQCVSGLGQVSVQFDMPFGFGVLTVDTLEQAIERAGAKAGNKGVEAALAAIEMINLIKQFQG
ncbi:MAG: 6,7-dimethyl-8-ribityllumazine synthase [Acidiferrobacterales bacterium]|nr:6,7-dimethyl-8-ribityllumazine synthase [Gammaproteobacteria bacterium]